VLVPLLVPAKPRLRRQPRLASQVDQGSPAAGKSGGKRAGITYAK
jgi:hypothetical protein